MIWLASPPAAGSIVALTCPPATSALATLCPVLSLMPRFLNARSSSAETSASSLGTSRGRNSTMVTSVPSER